MAKNLPLSVMLALSLFQPFSCLYNCQFNFLIDPKVISETFFFKLPLALLSNNLRIILLFLFLLNLGQAM